MRALVVEDEPLMAESIVAMLRRAAIAVDVAHDGLSGLQAAQENDYDVIVLDRDLPGMHGDEVCRRISADHADVRVLMLTAARRLDDKIEGFELGADDYLSKPFEPRELIARLRALDRRSSRPVPPVLTFGELAMNPFRREVSRDGHPRLLSRKEFAVLEVLMRAEGGVVSAEDLLERAWDRNANPFTNAIRVTISTLRKKLGEPWVIETVPGCGYRLVETNG